MVRNPFSGLFDISFLINEQIKEYGQQVSKIGCYSLAPHNYEELTEIMKILTDLELDGECGVFGVTVHGNHSVVVLADFHQGCSIGSSCRNLTNQITNQYTELYMYINPKM